PTKPFHPAAPPHGGVVVVVDVSGSPARQGAARPPGRIHESGAADAAGCQNAGATGRDREVDGRAGLQGERQRWNDRPRAGQARHYDQPERPAGGLSSEVDRVTNDGRSAWPSTRGTPESRIRARAT